MKADRSGSHCRFATARPSGFLSGVASAPWLLGISPFSKSPCADATLFRNVSRLAAWGLTPPRSERWRQRSDAQEFRRGFTLLEVMLSLTLAIILLGAIYAAMEQSWRLTASGRHEMARSQVTRALIKRIAQDVRAVMFVPPPPSDGETDEAASTSGTSTAGSTSTGTGTTGATDTTATDTTETEPSAKSIGIRGSATRLELHISRARRDLNFAANVDGNTVETRTSDLLAVTYSLALGSSGSTAGSGLIRSEGDRLIVQAIETDGGDALTASRSQSLAPEVASLAFRYFDGAAWYTMWDSEENGYLPRAIEVSIGFTPVGTRGGPLINVPVSASVDQFRTVILVPVADPFPPELLP